MGQLHLSLGQPQKALTVARQVAARDPRSQEAVRIQAQALDLLGRRQEALALLDGRLRDQPEDTEILACAAAIATQSPEDRDRAVNYQERLYRVTHDPLVRRQLLDLLLSLDRFKEAIPLQEEEAAQFPENQEALHRLALLHYWQRDYQAAGQVYPAPSGEVRGGRGLAPGSGPGGGRGPGYRQGPGPLPLALRPLPGEKGIRPGPGPPLVPERATMPRPRGSWPL